MPGKSSHVENERRYVAPKPKSTSKERATSSHGGTTAQKRAAGSKDGKATARSRS
jgi:hypothetical protein